MLKDFMLNLYAYNYWATVKIIEAAAKVPLEHFVASASHSHSSSLRGTLVHALSAEWIWRMRCQEQVFSDRPI